MGVHSKKAKEKYQTGNRYSEVAQLSMRQKRLEKWVKKSKELHPNAFDYKYVSDDFNTMKKGEVRVLCLIHNEIFKVLPGKHHTLKFGGCKLCEEEGRSSKRLKTESEKFLKWFNSERADYLDIISDFSGMTKDLKLRCKIHNSVKVVQPTSLVGNNGTGCDYCAKEKVAESHRLSLEDALAKTKGKLPEHIAINNVYWDSSLGRTVVEIYCDKHKEYHLCRFSHVIRSKYICQSCGEGNTGYARYKLQELIETESSGVWTRLAVMEIEALGILGLKVGVTTRTLEQRYGSDLRKVLFEVQLREIDAYVLENQIKRKFQDTSDLRIMKKGMRSGKRWSGDTEFYWFREKKNLISFIKDFLKNTQEKKPDYKKELDAFLIPTPFPRKINKKKGHFTKPREVIGIDPHTQKILHRLPSATSAKDLGYKNVSMVCSKKRHLSGGLRWFWADEFDEENIPKLQKKNHGLPVYCVERKQHFLNAVWASRELEELGIKCSPSHISSVINGKRKQAGGYTWLRSDLTDEEINNQSKDKILDISPMTPSNAPKSVKLMNVETDEQNSFSSYSEAGRFLAVQAAAISRAKKKRTLVKGWKVID